MVEKELMFVKLIDGTEPTIVNSDAVEWIEGISGGQHCMLHMSSGAAVRIPKPADEVAAALDWAAPQKEKRDARR